MSPPLFSLTEKNKDIKKQCEESIKIINHLWDGGKINVDFIICRLLFESVPVIRNQVLDIYIKKELYERHLSFYLIREVEQQLSPCLYVDRQSKEQHHEQDGWLIFRGTFSDEQAVVVIHQPHVPDHQALYTNVLLTGEDNLHKNQLNQLKHLRHPHIVSLLAFNTMFVPRFYVLQSFGNDLQQELQRRRENQTYYRQVDLVRLLIQVASAVEHCHAQGIIHRNLTAASLSAIAGPRQRALLGSFKLAHKLHGGKEEVVI
ncbi:serine/threonine protein kinase, partial [Elysia marginata]